jgi:nucleoside-diphosphate-sugar epimerase
VKVLLTGSRGFIGKHLHSNLINQGLRVFPITFSNESDDILHFDHLLKNPLEYLQRDDVLVHLASPKRGESRRVHEEFYSRSIELINVANLIGIKKIIVTGSGSEFGQTCNRLGKVRDSDLLLPMDEYSKSKVLISDYISKNVSIPFTYIRIFQVYGLGSNLPKLDAEIRKSILTKANLVIKTPDAIKDFVNLCDVIKLIINEILDSLGNNFINFSSGEGTSVLNFVEKIFSALPEEFRPNTESILESNQPIHSINYYVGEPSDVVRRANLVKSISQFGNLELLEALNNCRC